MKRKYDPLRDFLLKQKSMKRLRLTFARIETMMEARLPRSAYTHREWWANQADVRNRPQAQARSEAGFAVAAVYQDQLAGWVEFVREI